MAVLTAAPPAVRPVGTVTTRQRLTQRLRSTPGRLAASMVVLCALGLLAGITGVVGAEQRGNLVDGVRTRSGPLSVDAQQIYRALSDADATAASAFLAGGAEPAALRQRYLDDISEASSALTAATAGGADRSAVNRLAVGLPQYAGLVETARTSNRQGLPVGAAYLREASWLMRNQLLPAADELYTAEKDQLAADRTGAVSFPWVAIPLGIVLLVLLVRQQSQLSVRTHRMFNVGLVGATAAGLVMVLWLLVSWMVLSGHLADTDKDGSAQVQTLVKARIAALQARADESLTLVARGSGGQFETDFTKQADMLDKNGQTGILIGALDTATDPAVHSALSTALADFDQWRKAHTSLRDKDNSGDYPGAVTLAIGADKDSAASAFSRLDGELDKAISLTSATFDRDAKAGAGALTGQTPGIVVLIVLLLGGVIVGYQLRIAEYR